MAPLTNAQIAAAMRIGREIADEALKAADGSVWSRVRQWGSYLLAGLAVGLFPASFATVWWVQAVALVVLLATVVWAVCEARAWSRRCDLAAERLKAEKLPHLFGGEV